MVQNVDEKNDGPYAAIDKRWRFSREEIRAYHESSIPLRKRYSAYFSVFILLVLTPLFIYWDFYAPSNVMRNSAVNYAVVGSHLLMVVYSLVLLIYNKASSEKRNPALDLFILRMFTLVGLILITIPAVLNQQGDGHLYLYYIGLIIIVFIAIEPVSFMITTFVLTGASIFLASILFQQEQMLEWSIRANLVFTVVTISLLYWLNDVIRCRYFLQKQAIAKFETENRRQRKLLEEQNSVLEKLASHDGLTKIANRRELDQKLEWELYRMNRSKKPLTLILFDLDYFKLYNDTYGHVTGDAALIALVNAVKPIPKRKTDVLARYGGEEFAVILPHADADGGFAIAEKMRNSIFDLQIPHENSMVAPVVTASFGVLTMYPTCQITPVEALDMVDTLLYQAKEAGRNRAVRKSVWPGPELLEPVNRIIWRTEYTAGITSIDTQHKELLNEVNKFFAFLESGEATLPTKKEYFSKIYHAFMIHCKSEEQVLKNLGYPALNDHILAHERLKLKGQKILDVKSLTPEEEEEFIEFIVYEIIIKHLESEDALYFPLTRKAIAL